MKIVFLISSLDSGGAERVLTLMANHWAGAGHSVSIITFADTSSTPFYPLHSSIGILPLNLLSQSTGKWDAIRHNINRIFSIRRTISNIAPDVVISFMDTTNVAAILSTRGLGIPTVVAERVFPGCSEFGTAWFWLRNMTYPMADAIVSQTHSGKSYFGKAVRKKTTVIPNPVKEMTPPGSRPDDLPNPTVLAVGRLTHQKGFDILLRAFATIHKNHPDWHLTILGKGLLQEPLIQLRSQLGLNKVVSFLGTRKDIHAYYGNAELFVLPSRYEGFPNVLLEALSYSMPTIATNCQSGPAEILENGRYGALVPCEAPEDLARAIDKLIRNPDLRKDYRSKATNAIADYSINAIMTQWDSLLHSITSRSQQ